MSQSTIMYSHTNPSSSQLPPHITALAKSDSAEVDGPAYDYFLIEMVNTLRASSSVASARVKQIEQEMIESGLMPPPPPVPAASRKEPSSARDSTVSLGSQKGSAASTKPVIADEEEEALRARLEAIGMHVGANICERLCRDRPLFSDTLDMIKFICKDLWSVCWDKQVDNLRTNHRGVYVLQDNAFKPIARLSSWEGRQDAIRRARTYVAMPAGIIRGALSRLGLQGTVVPEVTIMPQCTFQVKLPKGV